MKLSLVFTLLLFFGWSQKELQAQYSRDNQPGRQKDSLSEHSVKKATWLAVALPGAGQLYNRQYWKAPIVWGGMGALGYLAWDNHRQHKIYLDAFFQRVDSTQTDDFVGRFDERQLIELQNIYADWRDLSIILGAVLWGLSIIDAHVDAHLWYYDVSDDLSWRMQPEVFQVQNIPAFGLGFKLQFR